MEKRLTRRERAFCGCFVNTGDATLAARRSGYADAEAAGEALLCRADVTREILRLSEQREHSLEQLAAAGYRRLAFGNIADAVSLLYMEHPAREELQGMDLFMVSEIKRPKDGSMEIKFFDRLKALEKLEGRRHDRDAAQQLIDAIGAAGDGDA